MARAKVKNIDVLIKGARVSFPHLFTRPVINGEEGKYGATLLIKKDSQNYEAVNGAVEEILRQAGIDKDSISPDRLCLRVGKMVRPEYDGYYSVSANNNKRPYVIDGQKQPVSNEEDCEIYAGCYVNAKIRLWWMDNNYGRRVCANLMIIQFAKHGDPMGNDVSLETAVEGFDEVETDDIPF